LAICKSIVKLHNGEIKASPEENGILIEIELPIEKRARLI
jgi:two-component system, OmpR family, sensor histidine kinase KdpD